MKAEAGGRGGAAGRGWGAGAGLGENILYPGVTLPGGRGGTGDVPHTSPRSGAPLG